MTTGHGNSNDELAESDRLTPLPRIVAAPPALIVTEALLVEAMLASELINRFGWYARQAFPETMERRSDEETGASWGGVVYRALARKALRADVELGLLRGLLREWIDAWDGEGVGPLNSIRVGLADETRAAVSPGRALRACGLCGHEGDHSPEGWRCAECSLAAVNGPCADAGRPWDPRKPGLG